MRLGYLHVPKCAGTALSRALYEAFDTRPLHIGAVLPPGSPPRRHGLERKTMAFRLAQCVPVLSGHITVSELRALDRDTIFTVLREPKARFFSVFTYQLSRANRPDLLERRPELTRFKSMAFHDFTSVMKPNMMASLLLKDQPVWKKISGLASDLAEELANDRRITAQIDRALGRFDMILAGDLPFVAGRLGAAIGRTIEPRRLNESQPDLVIEIGCSRAVFSDLLQRMTWLDEIVFRRAAMLFQNGFDTESASLDTAIRGFESRYTLRFG